MSFISIDSINHLSNEDLIDLKVSSEYKCKQEQVKYGSLSEQDQELLEVLDVEYGSRKIDSNTFKKLEVLATVKLWFEYGQVVQCNLENGSN